MWAALTRNPGKKDQKHKLVNLCHGSNASTLQTFIVDHTRILPAVTANRQIPDLHSRLDWTKLNNTTQWIWEAFHVTKREWNYQVKLVVWENEGWILFCFSRLSTTLLLLHPVSSHITNFISWCARWGTWRVLWVIMRTQIWCQDHKEPMHTHTSGAHLTLQEHKWQGWVRYDFLLHVFVSV